MVIILYILILYDNVLKPLIEVHSDLVHKKAIEIDLKRHTFLFLNCVPVLKYIVV